MFNLIIGYQPDRMDADRMLEYTSEHVKAYIAPSGVINPSRLLHMPTLMMPEIGSKGRPDLAQIGQIEVVTLSGKEFRFRFTPTPGMQPIPSEHIVDAALALGIDDWEFRRTHWAVKESDLYGNLLVHLSPPVAPITPKVFALPTVPHERDLVAVMMPFDAAFDPVYAALQDAVAVVGMRCERADDIWDNDHIIDDIISLIWRARVVIADLSGKNANVFYETGISHTLGRDGILITQHDSDVPFDLRSLRHVKYFPNEQGLQGLKAKIIPRLAQLKARA